MACEARRPRAGRVSTAAQRARVVRAAERVRGVPCPWRELVFACRRRAPVPCVAVARAPPLSHA
eukprot:1067378-Prymnesium_polylepis.1